MTIEPILTVNGVSKRFGGVLAVNDASFAVATGSIMGFGKHGYDLAVQAVAAALDTGD